MTDPTIEELELRVERGIRWLDEHDPGSVFHLWFTAGILPSAVRTERADDYAAYYKARRVWERLDERLARLTGSQGTTLNDIRWAHSDRRGR